MEPAGFFHIGYHRTGSTFLQQSVFPAYPEWIALRDSATFFFEEEEFRQGRDFYLAMNREPTDAPVVFESRNGMSGDMLEDRPEVAARIHAIVPDARIVIGIRDQRTVIPSFYFIYVKDGGTMSYGEYVDAVIANAKFDYARMVGAYLDRFGPERVLVLPYEDLQTDFDGYVRRFLDFVGIPRELPLRLANRPLKERHPDLTVRTTLALNRALYRPPLGLATGRLSFETRRRLRKRFNGVVNGLCLRAPEALHRRAALATEPFRPRIEAAYAESNRALAGLLGWPPARYAYPGLEGERRDIRPAAGAASA